MQERFGALDTMRGLAAVAVVLFHVAWLKNAADYLPHAYLAVDFFFILSGFVIALTYESRLAAGMPIADFLVRRLIRLYPMALVGVILGGAVLILKAQVDPAKVEALPRAAAGIAANLALLPDPFAGRTSQSVLFPGNGPLWSISLEIFINIVWCLLIVRAGTRALAALVLACFAGVVVCVLQAGDANLGFNWATLPGGLARVGFGFGLGTLFYRMRDRLIGTRRLAWKVLAAALLLAAFAGPSTGLTGSLWDIVCIGTLMPLAMILGLNGADHPWLDRILGGASYPLYAIHFPLLSLFSGLHQKLPQLGSGVLLGATAVSLAVATFVATKLYDEPMRRWLMTRWRSREVPLRLADRSASAAVADSAAVWQRTRSQHDRPTPSRCCASPGISRHGRRRDRCRRECRHCRPAPACCCRPP